MDYVIGIDLGTSSVKAILIDRKGNIIKESKKSYSIIKDKPNYSEQDPEVWVDGTLKVLKKLIKDSNISSENIKGISYSGQMHGLVLLDENLNVLRPAILWNDTRTTKECVEIYEKMGEEFINITKNKPLEGFTLPKLMWVKKNEEKIFNKAKYFLLPKDYLRFRMTGKISIDYSDAAGTMLLDVKKKKWSKKICDKFNIPISICPPLVESTEYVGELLETVSRYTKLLKSTSVFAGGADNACGAIGAGIINDDQIMSSIGTSGVILSIEDNDTDYKGDLHLFNHSIPNNYYSMGVTLSAGYSLDWYKKTFFNEKSLDGLIEEAGKSCIGANGLLFTPYLVGERTPYSDSYVRGSFIGIDAIHKRKDFTRAVIEGITFSLRDILEIYLSKNKKISSIISIGGGSQSELWLQMQADIFNYKIIKLENDEGPAMGAAIIAAIGVGWFDNFKNCVSKFINYKKVYYPNPENVKKYNDIYVLYNKIYSSTYNICHELKFNN